ncbi:alpha-hydroxy-acid oxidizing protein [Streptomyces sp. SCUT-3]|uniref:lactate 2-monooxygenase n=1 Tax=Streptomyces sp. SCUT-3 TaxID=2684469 RepID=UPI0015FB1F2C|nr:lactate 2-monooxygenase [Streptomyces sp. SCUT-3]QMV23693.1 alpha-hydroxy-acid oxidizing protein [Streptomyces sp. SCUT-3]
MPPFSSFQDEIYLHGLLTGEAPPFGTDPAGLEDAARERMSPEAYGYVAGGAGTGATMRANRAAFERRALVPRMLRDVGVRDLSYTLFGTRLPAPLLLAPVGVLSIVHPDAEPAAARAAAGLGLPTVLSTASSTTLEEVAEASGDGPRWFQLYWPKDRDVTVSLLRRARAAGYTALVVTLDTWLLGWRPRDLDRAHLPFLRRIGIANYLSDPAFLAGLAKPVEEDPLAAVAHWAGMFADPTKTWEDLAFLREQWDGPIVLKGVLHPDDARRARDAGMDGVVVSNHGGRQVDGAVAALDALPAVAGAVGEEITVLFDSGVRTGSDVLKALALGARAVLVGRPYVHGLALGGEAGVRHVLRCLLAELDLSLALTGHTGPAGLDPGLLAPPLPG